MALIEREDALDRLRTALSEAKEGRGSVVLVRGEAGIGKTALTRAFLDEIRADAHVLWGGCDDLVTARPLGPVWDMALDEPSLAETLSGDERGGAFRALLELLHRAIRPTVAVIEDVHWADESTLDLIKFIGRRIDRTHGMLLLTYRDGESSPDEGLRLALGGLQHGAVSRIELSPLSLDAVESLASGQADAVKVWEITRGNPFFVTELLSSGEEIPISIRDSVKSRLLRLSKDAREVAELASVAPRRIDLALVMDVLGEADRAVAECEEAEILVLADGALSFRHELARRAVESELPEIRRRSLNLAIMAACEAAGDDLSRCAHHARAAGDAEAILRLLPDAARRAAELGSHSEAVANLRALEPFLDRMGPEELADHYDLWAFEEYLATNRGSETLATRAVELRRRLGRPSRLGASLLVASRVAWVNGKRVSAVEYAREAAAVLESVGGESLGMAYSTVSQLAMLANEDQRALEYGKKAIEVAGPLPNAVAVHALNNIGTSKTNTRYPDGIEELQESLRMAKGLGLVYEQTRAAVNLAWAHLFSRDLEAAGPLLELGLMLTRDAEMPTFESYLVAEQAMYHEIRGEWAEASTLAHMASEGSWAHETSRAVGTMVMAKVEVRRGGRNAKDLAMAAWDLAVKIGEVQRLAPAGAVIAELAWLGGEIDRRLLGEVAGVLERCVQLKASLLGADLALWLSLLGTIDEVPAGFGEPQALLAGGSWKEAAAFWEQRSVPYEQAVALGMGDQESRIRALDILDHLGALPMAARIRSELQADGVRGIPRGPQRATRESPLGLTPRQTEVLELLAEGLTNAEIADRLFLSTRTIDHHVSAILGRTGADDRLEAVDIARRHRLIA